MFSAIYSGGTYTNTSQGNLGADQHPHPGVTYGAELADHRRWLHRLLLRRDRNPDAEGDAFVSGASPDS